MIDEEKIRIDYVPTELPNPESYWTDFLIEGRLDISLFLYGIRNRNKARLATIMLSYFHRHRVKFESVLVFEDQSEAPRLDLA